MFIDMKQLIALLAILIISPLVTLSAQSRIDSLDLKEIFYEPLLPGKRPSFVRFSMDDSSLYYYGNDSAFLVNKLYRVNIDGTGTVEIPLDSFTSHPVVSPHRDIYLFTKGNKIHLVNNEKKSSQNIISTSGVKYGIIWAPDSMRFAYVQDGNVMIMDIEKPQLSQVTFKKHQEPLFRPVKWLGNKAIVVEQYDNSSSKTVYFPEYLGSSVKPGDTKRGYAERSLSIAFIDRDTLVPLYKGKDFVKIETSPSGRYVALDHTDIAMKKRRIETYDVLNSKFNVVFRESTDGWIYYTGMQYAPHEDILMFQSERDGWNHLYTVSAGGNDFRQITDGPYEIHWYRWLNDATIIFASSEEDPGERHLRKLKIKDGRVEKLTVKDGYRDKFNLSRDKKHIVYERSYFNEPTELYSLEVDGSSLEKRLTYSVPERFSEIDWQTPDYLRIDNEDDTSKLSMTVLKPRKLDEDSKHPVIVFVHGAGSLQNVYKGWSENYWREYMFHQFMAHKGYYVIEVDYHHSTGYGREFREKVAGWMGKYETDDIINGLKFLSENYPQVDLGRVGIYGGSYGGFMALYAVSTAPAHFHAAAALRAVTNWKNYYEVNPWYTLPRLGTPERDSINYHRSSPLSYVDDLQAPVLILHGLIDNNVPYRDAAQYVQKLIEAGDKTFDFMMYPGESHSFISPAAWYDEYRRIQQFMDKSIGNVKTE